MPCQESALIHITNRYRSVNPADPKTAEGFLVQKSRLDVRGRCLLAVTTATAYDGLLVGRPSDNDLVDIVNVMVLSG